MFINVLTQVIIIFILVILGVILARAKILNDNAVKSMTDLVLLLVTPSVIIKSFIREFDASTLKSLLISFLIAFLTHIGFIILSRFTLKDNLKSKETVLQFSVIFSNCGFMSIPLQQALLGEDGVFFGSSYIAIFNMFVWSYGIILMSGDKSYLSPKKLILNPAVIAIVTGLFIFFFSIPIPKIISEPLTYMASLNTPLPMIIIGYHLASSNILDGIKNLKCIFAIILRLFIFPLIALGVMYLCSVRGTMLISSVISCSAPAAALTTMFASKYERDTSLSVSLVSLSTVFSIISMPVLITLAQYIA